MQRRSFLALGAASVAAASLPWLSWCELDTWLKIKRSSITLTAKELIWRQVSLLKLGGREYRDLSAVVMSGDSLVGRKILSSITNEVSTYADIPQLLLKEVSTTNTLGLSEYLRNRLIEYQKTLLVGTKLLETADPVYHPAIRVALDGCQTLLTEYNKIGANIPAVGKIDYTAHWLYKLANDWKIRGQEGSKDANQTFISNLKSQVIPKVASFRFFERVISENFVKSTGTSLPESASAQLNTLYKYARVMHFNPKDTLEYMGRSMGSRYVSQKRVRTKKPEHYTGLALKTLETSLHQDISAVIGSRQLANIPMDKLLTDIRTAAPIKSLTIKEPLVQAYDTFVPDTKRSSISEDARVYYLQKTSSLLDPRVFGQIEEQRSIEASNIATEIRELLELGKYSEIGTRILKNTNKDHQRVLLQYTLRVFVEQFFTWYLAIASNNSQLRNFQSALGLNVPEKIGKYQKRAYSLAEYNSPTAEHNCVGITAFGTRFLEDFLGFPTITFSMQRKPKAENYEYFHMLTGIEFWDDILMLDLTNSEVYTVSKSNLQDLGFVLEWTSGPLGYISESAISLMIERGGAGDIKSARNIARLHKSIGGSAIIRDAFGRRFWVKI